MRVGHQAALPTSLIAALIHSTTRHLIGPACVVCSQNGGGAYTDQVADVPRRDGRVRRIRTVPNSLQPGASDPEWRVRGHTQLDDADRGLECTSW